MRKRFAAEIRGVVQGVFFRQSTRSEAVRLGVSGSVGNRPDGSVRVIAEGEEESLLIFLAWLREGPPRAVVERVDVQWTEPRGEIAFHIER